MMSIQVEKRIQTVILIVIATIASVNLKEPCRKPAKLTKDGNYTIVGLFPLHLHDATSGKYVFNLQASVWAEAMIFAINEINANKSLLGNITLGYKIYDTCNMESTAQLSILELLLDETESENNFNNMPNTTVEYKTTLKCNCRANQTSLAAFIGGASSKISTIVSTILGVDSIPQISYSSTSTELSVKEYYPSFLRTIPPDNFQAEFIVDILQYYDWKYINVLASDDSYGRVGVDYLIPQLTAKGMCVGVLAIFSTALKPEDVENTVRKLINGRAANVTVLWSGKTAARAIISAAAQVKLFGQTWIATEGWGGDEEILKGDHRVLQGLFGVIPLMKFYEPFEKHIIGKTLKDLQAYKLFYNAAKCNNSNLNQSAKICLKHHVFKNASNSLRIKIPNVVDAVYAVANGLKQSLLGKHNSELKISHLKLLDIIKSLKFKGSTGMNVHFNRNGDPSTAAYSLLNTRLNQDGQLAFQITGQWDSESRRITLYDDVNIEFAGNSSLVPLSKCADECKAGQYALTETNKKCCWKCLSCPQGTYKPNTGNHQCRTCPKWSIANENNTACMNLEKKYLNLNSVHGVVIAIFSAVGALFSLAGVSIFLIFRETPLVRSSNRELSLLQLVISTLAFLYPLLYIVKPNLVICYSRPLAFGILFTISNSIIFTKADRLLRIFKMNYRIKRRSVTLLLSNKFQLVIVASMAGLAILLCMMSFALSPIALSHEINVECRTVHIKCINIESPINILVAYMGVISLTCIVYTFKSRNLPRQFREGRYIGLGMFVASLTWLFYLPVSFSGKLRELQDFAFCIAVLLSNATLLFVIYGPKTWRILLHPEENNLVTFRNQLMTFTMHASEVEVK